jgi:hypothetical protein
MDSVNIIVQIPFLCDGISGRCLGLMVKLGRTQRGE